MNELSCVNTKHKPNNNIMYGAISDGKQFIIMDY